MRKLIILSLVTITLSFTAPKKFGVGIILGEPTGISLKYWVNRDVGVAGELAWSLGGYLHVHGDFLLHERRLLKDLNIKEGSFVLHYGIGARLKAEKRAVFGIRIPLGINFIFRRLPLDIFLEIVPVMNLIPSTTLDLNGGIGLRFYPF